MIGLKKIEYVVVIGICKKKEEEEIKVIVIEILNIYKKINVS